MFRNKKSKFCFSSSHSFLPFVSPFLSHSFVSSSLPSFSIFAARQRFLFYSFANFSSSDFSNANFSNAKNEQKWWWRTTHDRLFNYDITDEEKRNLEKQHETIMNDIRLDMDEEEMRRCMYTQYFTNLEQRSFFYRMVDYLNKHLFSPRSHMTKFLNLAFAQSQNQKLREIFKISDDDFCSKTYFFLIHVWLLHRRMDSLGAEGMKFLFWEKIWDYFRFVLSNEKVGEFSFNSNLVNIQQYCYGFCLGLDESLDSNAYQHFDRIWAAQLQYVLWMNIFNGREEDRYSKHLNDLTVYTLKMLRFVEFLPKEYFYEGAFEWPSWESESLSSSSSSA